MIPLKLTLRNFMCYRDNVPSINFESIHTACISGSNGHGKSALIDAITWALWGQTRAASDDELVHTGQKEAEVDFEFAVSDQRYRIIRKHAVPKNQKSSGQTLLEFHLINPEGIKVMTGDTITLTQQKIIHVLHMDYDTFINSAFIRQGHSNEFTRKRPGERKQVLGNILQLSVYDDLEDRAKELSKEQQNSIDHLQSVLSGIREEIDRRPEYQAEYERAQTCLQELESQTALLETRLSLLRKDRELAENKKAQLEEISKYLLDTEQNIQQWTDQASQCHKRILGYEELLAHRENIEKAYQDYIKTRRILQDQDQKARQFSALSQVRHHLEMAIVNAQGELNQAHAVAENRIRDMDTQAEKLPALQEELRELDTYLKKIEQAEKQIDTNKINNQQNQVRLQFLQSEQIRLSTEIDNIKEKLKLLSHQSGAICPLCESELGLEGKGRIESKYQIQKSEIEEALRTNLAETNSLSATSLALDNEIQQAELKTKKARESARNKQGQLSKAAADASGAAQKTLEERKILEDIEHHLITRDFAIAEQESLSLIEKEIAALQYDQEFHERTRLASSDLEKNESPMRKLEQAQHLIQQEKLNEAQAICTAGKLLNKMEVDSQRKRNLLVELDSLCKIADDLRKAENEYQGLSAEQKRLREKMGAARALLDRLDEQEKRLGEQTSLLKIAVRQEKIYKDLAGAFGKKGLQSMLIEMAVPEIEAEANRLLMHMTDNRMAVKLETQRATRKGDVQETLDINISDELGTRNYEMFSGGEAFRIDFAIRIALSKLLAHRAGASLPTLIIDEGFGTQDVNGIEKIKDAIASIQDDFEKILVITHITDFKDAFPMQIEVVKTGEGSTVFLN